MRNSRCSVEHSTLNIEHYNCCGFLLPTGIDFSFLYRRKSFFFKGYFVRFLTLRDGTFHV